MASGVSAQDFENWLTPKQSVEILDSAWGSGSDSFTSKHTLLECLRAGMVRAVARTSKWSTRVTAAEFEFIPADEWGHVSENTIFWTTGDLTYRIAGASYGTIAVRRFDVRFDQAAVRAIITPATKRAAVEPPSALKDEDDPVALEPVSKRPSVSDKDLWAWYSLYQSIYPDTSEDHVWRSAQGMFHDKEVSRSRIRKMRGERPMGRPKTP